MRLPTVKTQFMRIVQFGRYVVARLRRVGHAVLAEGAEAATIGVMTAGRALEDTVVPIQDATAHRDLAADALKDAARDLRLALLSRGQEAPLQPPYTLIFPDGVNYYVSAAQDEIVLRYQELRSRVIEALSDDDAARSEAVARIDAGIAQYAETINEINDAKNAVALARTRCDVARRQWDDAMLKVYASLLPGHGKKGAEKFFPKWQKQKKNGKPEKAEKATNGPKDTSADSANSKAPDKAANGASSDAPKETAANGAGSPGTDSKETPVSEPAA